MAGATAVIGSLQLLTLVVGTWPNDLGGAANESDTMGASSDEMNVDRRIVNREIAPSAPMSLPLTAYTMRKARTDASRASKIIDAWKGWGTAIPDSKATFVREFASGNTAVIEVVWKGVHKGPPQTPSGTIPPSNKSIEIPACQVVQVEGSKVKSVTHYFDMLTLLTQIGAVKG